MERVSRSDGLFIYNESLNLYFRRKEHCLLRRVMKRTVDLLRVRGKPWFLLRIEGVVRISLFIKGNSLLSWYAPREARA